MLCTTLLDRFWGNENFNKCNEHIDAVYLTSMKNGICTFYKTFYEASNAKNCTLYDYPHTLKEKTETKQNKICVKVD